MKKRWISLLLVLLMAVALTAGAWAASPDSGGYQDAIRAAMAAEDAMGGYYADDAVGQLYDIDGNGNKELLLLYSAELENDLGYQMPCCVASLYTLSGGQAVPLLENALLYVYAGGPSGSAGVVELDGSLYFCIQVDNWEGSDCYSQWQLYSLAGESLSLETDLRYSAAYYPEVAWMEGTLNGETISQAECQALLDSMEIRTQLTEPDAEGSYAGIRLPSLLSQLEAGTLSVYDTGLPFMDIPGDAWYRESVDYVYREGLMSGTGDNCFEPENTLTRAMLVTVLYRLAGAPDISDENLGYPYADVDAASWYANGVYWARLHGIVAGYSAENFGPNDPITREQLALILYRYARWAGYDTAGRADLSAFADADAVSDWAEEAVSWAVDAGLLSGKGGGLLDSAGTASRAEVAAVLMRFCTGVAR